MKKYIGLAMLFFVLSGNISIAQVARPRKEERAAMRAERREYKSNNKLQDSDRKKDRKLQKKEDKLEKKGRNI